MLAVNVVMFVQESVSVAFVCLGWMLYQITLQQLSLGQKIVLIMTIITKV